MDLGLGNRHALVLGSSRGLGFAIAQELLQEGASVTICGRSPKGLAAAREALSDTARAESVTSVVADVSRASDRERLFDVALHQPRELAILVTNAGGPPSGRFEQTTVDQWRAAYRVTLESASEAVRAALPSMAAQGYGRVIMITSMAVKQPIANLVLSNSMRLAVAGLAKTLAVELAPLGITVNNLMPGYTDTDRVRDLARAAEERGEMSSTEYVALLESQVPLGRLGQPREFAAMAAFLASERASYVTGQSIAVDGGWTKSAL